MAPKIGAIIYIQRCSKCPETNAGAIERAGFIEAPEIGPANIASSKTVEPIAIPANKPCSLLPCATFKITSIKKKARKISKINDCISVPDGHVPPSILF